MMVVKPPTLYYPAPASPVPSPSAPRPPPPSSSYQSMDEFMGDDGGDIFRVACELLQGGGGRPDSALAR